jgi:hypothetical protein
MPLLRLAYATQFLIAVIAIFTLWSQVGGQGHLDIMPWYLKLVLGVGAAVAVVKTTAAAVAAKDGWSARVIKWLGILLALLLCCGLATYYVHVYGESDEDNNDEENPASLSARAAPYHPAGFESAFRLARPAAAPPLKTR